MEEQIKLLIELQGLDSEIFRLKKNLDAKPEEIKALDDAFKEKEEKTKSIDTELKKIQVEHKNKEIELKTKEEAAQKLQSQLYQVKTNKEYTALENEIKTVRADSSLLEEEIINLLDKIEEAEKVKKEIGEDLKAERQKVDEAKKKIAEETKKIEQELVNFQKQRDALAEKVDKNILSKYERILYGKDGLAIVAVRNNSCQGCFLNLPPQVINEIRMKKDLIFCESCARILYTDE
jgi:hypothetical protein